MIHLTEGLFVDFPSTSGYRIVNGGIKPISNEDPMNKLMLNASREKIQASQRALDKFLKENSHLPEYDPSERNIDRLIQLGESLK